MATLPAVLAPAAAAGSARPPNIVVIITDDQGYADISTNPHHRPEVSTPNIQALAQEGVFFTQAYVSAPTCAPTRSGLMLGRYQQRVGVFTSGDGGDGFDPRIRIFPAFLPQRYRKTAIGKWHLGEDEDYPVLAWHAMNRGFDECYKFMGRGAHDYFELTVAESTDSSGPLYRNRRRIDDEGYLTTRITEEAVKFVRRNRDRPFFLYLAYNAIHTPLQAPRQDVQRIKQEHPGISGRRATLMAMLEHLDAGVGAVVAKLKQEGIWDDTLLFFLSDNGGIESAGDNSPLRGNKNQLYEGGIRTPLIVSWPRRVRGSRTIDTPVIALDILPTVLDAIGKSPPPNGPAFDGRSLLPLLRGKTDTHHERLFWSTGADGRWAVREGDWKLISVDDRLKLFNLATDPSETRNRAANNRARVRDLQARFDAWLAEMPPFSVSGLPSR